jgi:hypothetical protein
VGLGLAAKSSVESGPWPKRRRGSVLADGSVVAGRRQGAASVLTGATGRVSGKAVGGGAHSNDGAA